MSHIASVELEIKDLDALAAAAEQVGLAFRRDQATYHCWATGRSREAVETFARGRNQTLDDFLPPGYTFEDLGRCAHAIHLPGTPYELGVVARRDGRPGYALHGDLGMMRAQVDQYVSKLRQAYAEQVAVKQARREGFRVVGRRVGQDGKVHLQLQR